MRTKTYRAGTMREALALVRRDLGGDAVILRTREVRRRRLFGLGTRELVEVTAQADSGTQVGRAGTDGGTRPVGRSTRSSARSSGGCTRWSRA